jgi:hypothetical protein
VLLRASGTISGREHDLRAIMDPEAAEASGIVHAGALLRFVDAAIDAGSGAKSATELESELEASRAALRAAVGPAGLVDAAAVLGNFERMTRIADATGIPLDAPTDMMSADFRGSLGLDRFASAAQTPRAGRVRVLLADLLRPIGAALLRLVSRRRARSGSAR